MNSQPAEIRMQLLSQQCQKSFVCLDKQAAICCTFLCTITPYLPFILHSEAQSSQMLMQLSASTHITINHQALSYSSCFAGLGFMLMKIEHDMWLQKGMK